MNWTVAFAGLILATWLSPRCYSLLNPVSIPMGSWVSISFLVYETAGTRVEVDVHRQIA
jgi:hypothetical protein